MREDLGFTNIDRSGFLILASEGKRVAHERILLHIERGNVPRQTVSAPLLAK